MQGCRGLRWVFLAVLRAQLLVLLVVRQVMTRVRQLGRRRVLQLQQQAAGPGRQLPAAAVAAPHQQQQQQQRQVCQPALLAWLATAALAA
jgi:predicted lipid-binding transport protein (Tim44 family)